MELRTATAQDIRDVLAVWIDADAEPTITDDEEALRTLLDRDPDSLVVAVEGERIIATLVIAWDGWRGTYYRLAVLPEFRRRGIGRHLVREGERRLMAIGVRRVALFAVTVDTGAFAFWTALGYLPQQHRLRFVKNVAD